MASFPVRGGRCVLTEDEVRIETGRIPFLKQVAGERPLVAAVTILTFCAAVVGGVGTILMVLFLEQVPSSIFRFTWQLAVIASLVFAGSLFFWATSRQSSIGRGQRADTYPENASDEEVIPYDSIESVSIETDRTPPLLLIYYRQQEREFARPVQLRKEKASVESIRDAFQSKSVPVETEASPSE